MSNLFELENIINGLIGSMNHVSYQDRSQYHRAYSVIQISRQDRSAQVGDRVGTQYKPSHSHGCNGTGSGIATDIRS